MTEHNPLRDMLSNVMSGDLKAAGEAFGSAMDSKVGEALDAEKVAIASSLYAEAKEPVAEDDHEDEGEEAEGDKKKKKSEEDDEEDAAEAGEE